LEIIIIIIIIIIIVGKITLVLYWRSKSMIEKINYNKPDVTKGQDKA